MDSSNTAVNTTPEYQSKYLLAAGSLGANAKTESAGFRLNNYSRNLVPGGGVYNYMANRYRNKATQSICNSNSEIVSGTYNSGNMLYYCTGDTYINTDLTITGNPIIFVDGDLHILAGGVSVGAEPNNNSVVFVVKGDIISYFNLVTGKANLSLDGIYIARKSFRDTDPTGTPRFPSSATTWQLKVNGAVYVDGEEGGSLQLARYYPNQSGNNQNATNLFRFVPKYLVLLNSILAEPTVGWKEIGP